jgi:hypothetical protein
MKPLLACLFIASVLVAPACADDKPPIPQFQVEPFWPKPLPNNWILGQVSGIAVDRHDRIWVVHRPRTLNEREVAAAQNPPTAKCCVAAPPVLPRRKFLPLMATPTGAWSCSIRKPALSSMKMPCSLCGHS